MAAKKFWYVTLEREVTLVERAEDIEVEAETEAEAEQLARAKVAERGFMGWDESERREDDVFVECATTYEDDEPDVSEKPALDGKPEENPA